jgi:hypothetical protein
MFSKNLLLEIDLFFKLCISFIASKSRLDLWLNILTLSFGHTAFKVNTLSSFNFHRSLPHFLSDLPFASITMCAQVHFASNEHTPAGRRDATISLLQKPRAQCTPITYLPALENT